MDNFLVLRGISLDFDSEFDNEPDLVPGGAKEECAVGGERSCCWNLGDCDVSR